MEGGHALALLLSGKENFSGRLPFTMAKNENDYPDFLFPGDKTRTITYGYYHGYTLLEQQKKTAAFPFGFGLSYTTFAYTDPHITDEGDRYAVSLTVQNTGNRDGKTVIQIYAAAPGERAEKKLKGFRKVFVKAGERVAQTVYVEKEDLRFYDPEQKTWYLADHYEFFVGQHCEDTLPVQF